MTIDQPVSNVASASPQPKLDTPPPKPTLHAASRHEPTTHHAANLLAMLDALSLDDAALALVDGRRERILLRGVREARAEPEVAQAFTVLYDDLLPVRVAGDRIFAILRPIAEAAAREEAKLRAEAPFSAEELTLARRLFDTIDADASGSIDRDELSACGIVHWAAGDDAVLDQVLDEVDRDGDGQISFLEFLYALARLLLPDVPSGGRDFLPPTDVLARMTEAEAEAERLLVERGAAATAGGEAGGRRARVRSSSGAHLGARASKERARAGERFDAMLEEFGAWEGSGVSVDRSTRLGVVLGGCFAGARNAHVVATLRVCFCEYRPLRLVGELIFSLMRRVVSVRVVG